MEFTTQKANIQYLNLKKALAPHVSSILFKFTSQKANIQYSELSNLYTTKPMYST
jgi:hypothetical protein